MNAFRLVFLASVLGASVLFAFARLTPDVWQDQMIRTLEQRAESEVRTALAVERHAMAEREATATHIAADRMIAAALDPSNPDAPSVAPTFARVRDAHVSDDASWAVLFDARGEPVAPAAFRGVISPRDFGEIADVARALESGEVQVRYSVVTGRLFAAVAVPVRGAGTRPMGAVVVAHEMSGRTAAERRAAGALDLAFFANREVIAVTTSNIAVNEELASLVRRTDANSVGTRHGIRGRSVLQYTSEIETLGDAAEVEAQERIAMLVPVRFDNANDPLAGAVVIVDAASPPSTLAGILIEGRAFDDSTVVVWVFVMGGLLIFFIGLLVHDFAQSRAIRTLADGIADRITMNDPTPLKDDAAARYLRPISDAFNRFLEAYRQTTHSARNARAEASVASQEVDQLQHQIQELREGSGEIHVPVSTRRINRPSGGHRAIASRRPTPPPTRPKPVAPPTSEGTDLLDPDAFGDEPSAVGIHTIPASAGSESRAESQATDSAPTFTFAADEDDSPSSHADTASAQAKDGDDVPAFDLVADTLATNPSEEADIGEDNAPGLSLADDPDVDPFDALDALASGSTTATSEVSSPPDNEPPRSLLDMPDLGASSSSTSALDYDDSSAFEDVLPPFDTSGDESTGSGPPEADTVLPGATSEATWTTGAVEQLTSLLDEDAAPTSNPVDESGPADHEVAAADEEASEAASDSGGGDLLAAAEARLKRIRMSRNSASFPGVQATPSDPKASDTNPELRALYDEFIESKRSAGDDVSRMTFESFASRIEKNRAKLCAQYGCSDAKFRVEVKDGRVTLKATPVR